VGGHRLSRRLLKRLVGEQPVGWIVELRRGPTPQDRRLHQDRGALTETLTRRGNVGDQCGIGEPQVSDVAQRPLPDVATQVRDVVEPKIYDDKPRLLLTPVLVPCPSGVGPRSALRSSLVVVFDGLTPVTITL